MTGIAPTRLNRHLRRRPSDSAVGAPATIVGPVLTFLRRLHDRNATLRDGAVATYIPELATADPDTFGICVVTVDGAVYEVGDSRAPFTIQSMSKPLTYGLTLDDLGEREVRTRIGVEPTGDAFNAITLSPATGTPLNPMVNAGAITAVSMVARGDAHDGHDGGADPFDRILATIARYVGHSLEVDEAVFLSERQTGHRNRAIAHLLRASGALDGDPGEVVDRYFRQCAIRLDTRDLAVIAATLANGGVNPVSGEVAASESAVRAVLSVMTSCGMYDAAGAWLYDVGLPAKSGVSGGILAVLPGQLGIAVYSPPLDARGNSVRGLAVCRDLSNDLGLHLVRGVRAAVAPIRSQDTLATLGSKRLRPECDRDTIAAAGAAVVVLQLQGELSFLAVEAIARQLTERLRSGPTTAVLDLWRVNRVDPATPPLLADLARDLAQSGGRLVISSARRHPSLEGQLSDALDGDAPVGWFAELDHALEWCEEQVLAAGAAGGADRGRMANPDGAGAPGELFVPLADHEFTRGLQPDELDRLRSLVVRRRYATGDLLVGAGDPATELFVVVAGRLSVSLPLASGERRRLTTLTAGSIFGELALLGRDRRTADVVADSTVDCEVLSIDAFNALGRADPLRAVLLENLLRIVSRTARRMTGELAMLAG
jgi:glutaminase